MNYFLNENLRPMVEEEAVECFRKWVCECSDAELVDMLFGNTRAYNGMPNLSPFASEDIKERIQYTYKG